MILLHQHCSKTLFFSIPVIFAFSTRDIFPFIDTNLKKIIIVDRIIHKQIIPAFFIIIAFFPLPYPHFCLIFIQFSSVQFSHSVMSDSATPWIAPCQASLSITNSQRLLKPMSIESVMSSNHLILCHPLLLLPSIFPSIRVFSNESVLQNRWPKYWSFSFSISISNEYSGLISFTIDWFDLLAFQGTLKSLLQTHIFIIFLKFNFNF